MYTYNELVDEEVVVLAVIVVAMQASIHALKNSWARSNPFPRAREAGGFVTVVHISPA